MKGLELKRMRELRDWSQEQLAEKVGKSKRTIIYWEQSEIISKSNVKLIHSVFNSSSNENLSPKSINLSLEPGNKELTLKEAADFVADNIEQAAKASKYFRLTINDKIEDGVKLRLEELGIKIRYTTDKE